MALENLQPVCAVTDVGNDTTRASRRGVQNNQPGHDPITHIINQSLHSGIFPDNLKLAKVIPIDKKGDNTSLNNYRPISILPSISKVFERVMFDQLYEHFRSNSLFYESQYGFKKNQSTEPAAYQSNMATYQSN